MRPSTWRIVAVICGVLLVAGCGGNTAQSSQTSTQPIPMSVSLYPGSLISLPGYIAQQKGFFKNNGLDVSLVTVNGGPAAIAALLSNSVQMMLNATDLNMQTTEKGEKIVVAAGDTNHMIFSLIARNDIATPNQGKYPAVMTDLKGKKIGVTQRGSSVELFVHTMLKDAGMDPNKDVTFVGVGLPGTALPAMENKLIDAYMAFEPMQTLAVTQKKEAKILVDLRKGEGNALFKEWDYNSWATTAAYANSNKEAIKRFQKAMRETQDWMHDSKTFDELVQLTAQALNLAAPTASDMLKGNLDTFGYKMSSKAISNASEFLVSNGLLKNPVKFSDYVLPGT